ncbi:MFS transporter, DHA1 family, bicyclomycin/chloramphenicol resistance protein [Lutibacter oricola]|uniref:MFS transporter, DHA1 family, bicyclomycin/chloramphenicol resistance protein n=1 Tax=Lutibacter oricola TaxID=762486 RepID=A0A1H2XEP8_9FLAO|nr:multidrug effflux MFS transporter [Lutibacter oricola]SDW91226.1 MFS transporter, DHA1 family, bicyclomycin/chloramphenicol resistance protein [Lutibacter oricola]
MQKKKIPQLEFIALMASLMSIAALAIDALLPALDIIGQSVGTESNSENQLLITMIFLGLGIGPLVFGPISDSLGRKPVVYIGFIIFIVASFVCVNAQSIVVMITGRIIQGIGLSAPRTVSIAIVRDTFNGDYMARIMSFITVVFLLVPTFAPVLGKIALDSFNWEAIFYFQLLIVLLISVWFWFRQPETLHPEYRIKFTKLAFLNGCKELFKYKQSIGYTVISGFIFGSFMVYLSTAQQIFQQQYKFIDEFPYIFAGLTIAMVISSLSNGTIVVKFGMKRIARLALYLFFITSLIYVFLFYSSSNPSIEIILAFFMLQFLSIGFLFGNLRALAMQPIAHIAGIGAAITGFISTILAVIISAIIGKYVGNTALPLFIGFSICSGLSILVFNVINIKSKNVAINNA